MPEQSEVSQLSFNRSMPKVSVIVATYRRTDTLERALISLANQTYSNYEIIVVDDNANSEWNYKVEQLISSFKSTYVVQVKYICNKENKGSAKTRNAGIQEAEGEYITFLDDDDVYLNNKIKNQVEHMIEEKSDYSVTDMWLYNKDDVLVEKRERSYIEKTDSFSILKYHILYHITGPDSMMFKKDFLIKIGMFTPIDVGDDYYLIEKAIEEDGKFSYLPVCDLKAYVHTDGSGLSSGDSKIEGENQLYNYKTKHFNILNKVERKYVIMRHYAVIAYAEWRRKNIQGFFKNILLSFTNSPKEFISLLRSHKV